MAAAATSRANRRFLNGSSRLQSPSADAAGSCPIGNAPSLSLAAASALLAAITTFSSCSRRMGREAKLLELLSDAAVFARFRAHLSHVASRASAASAVAVLEHHRARCAAYVGLRATAASSCRKGCS